MTIKYPDSLLTLISMLKKLPGVGSRTAERFAFELVKWKHTELENFSKVLFYLKERIKTCSVCGCISDENFCKICGLNSESKEICIVSSSKDVFAIEKTNSYKGLYHVIDSLLSPMSGKGQDSLYLDKLVSRIQKNKIKEIIIALDSTLEGDATSLFIKDKLDQLDVKVSRLAFGLPVGSSMEYVDGGTLTKALIGRQNF